MVRIPGFHPGDPGSIPGRGIVVASHALWTSYTANTWIHDTPSYLACNYYGIIGGHFSFFFNYIYLGTNLSSEPSGNIFDVEIIEIRPSQDDMDRGWAKSKSGWNGARRELNPRPLVP